MHTGLGLGASRDYFTGVIHVTPLTRGFRIIASNGQQGMPHQDKMDIFWGPTHGLDTTLGMYGVYDRFTHKGAHKTY